MGTLRFFLAVTVALSHMGVTFLGGHNPGVVAVILFFLISGFVMTGLVRSYYPEYRLVPMFYVDRLARIFPQYLLFLTLAVTTDLLFEFSSPYLSSISLSGIVANLLVIPLDFFQFSHLISECMFIPQAWSLGLELMFYMLFPFVLISGQRNKWFVLSLMVWFVAASGLVNTDIWGYRLLPGTLFIFLLGSYIYDIRQPALSHPVVRSLMLIMIGAILLQVSGKIAQPYSLEVLIGLFLGVPCLFVLSGYKRCWWDDWFGNLSYGIFLSHFMVLWLFESLNIVQNTQGILMMLMLSIVLAYLGYIGVERPVLRWRHSLRQGVS